MLLAGGIRGLQLDGLLGARGLEPLTSASRTPCYCKFWLCFTPYEGLLAACLFVNAKATWLYNPEFIYRRFLDQGVN